MSAKPKPPRCNVADLRAGQRVDEQVFRVAARELRTTSNGSLYIHAVLADATGEILGRMWNATQEIYDGIPAGGFLICRGRVESYKGAPQFILDGVRIAEADTYNPADFLPATRRDVAQMWDELKSILRGIENRDLLALVGKFVHDEEFAGGFQRAPAATSFHHAWLGGLLEHTLGVLRAAQAVCPLYPQVSRDLVLAGVLLHDAGKIRELAYRTNFEYSDEGQLVGHITQAVLWLHDKCAELSRETGRPFPAELETALTHLILAHHGKYEFGSPRLPATPEALMIHYLDNLDAKLNMMFEAIACDPDATSHWTSYVKALETRVYKPDVLHAADQT